MQSSKYYKRAKWFGAGLALCLVLILVMSGALTPSGPIAKYPIDDTYLLIGGFIVSLVSLVGTISNMILGWRADRRAEREAASKRSDK
jgi:hypothetical protein